ncbi:MAG: tryptophan-rich sensory protein [bacterium]|nr:MAG: tryptophan-rich sensory protein [bacterium]
MCLAAELTGGLLTAPAIASGWYGALRKPSFNPPDWVFGPVWTVLFLLMAVSAWLVWKSGLDRKAVRLPLILFYVQLVLNVMWSALFFAAGSTGWALAEIILLWAAIMATTVLFARIHRTAALLMVPYLGWVLFAAVLNAAIWYMNRGLPGPGAGMVS